jgi:hypothetical protein
VSGEAIALLAFLALALVLPVAALRDRNLDFSKGWKMAAIWVALFVLAALVFAWIGM